MQFDTTGSTGSVDGHLLEMTETIATSEITRSKPKQITEQAELFLVHFNLLHIFVIKGQDLNFEDL